MMIKKFFFLTRNFVNLPNYAKKNNYNFLENCNRKNAWKENVVSVDAENGIILKTYDLFSILSEFNFFKKIDMTNHYSRSDFCSDPLHLNDVRVITKQNLNFLNIKDLQEGDLMISLKGINSIIIISKKTSKILWSFSNFSNDLHSPRIYQDKLILIDNKSSFSKSAVKIFDFNKKKLISKYEGGPNHFFYTGSAGRLQLINDNIYVTSAHQGELFKLSCIDDFKNCKFDPIFSFNYFRKKYNKYLNFISDKDFLFIADLIKNE